MKTPSGSRQPSTPDATEPTDKPSTPGALASLAISTAKTPPPRSRAKLYAIIGASAGVVGVVAFVASRDGNKASTPPATNTTTAVSAPAPVAPTPEPPVTAEPTSTPSATVSSEPQTVAPAKKPPPAPAATVRPKPSPVASGAASAPKPPSEGDLLQDRR
jgi:hypothetical protein